MDEQRHLESLCDRLARAHAVLACPSRAEAGRRQACAVLRTVRPADLPTREQRELGRLLQGSLAAVGAAAPADPDDLLGLRDCAAELLRALEDYMASLPVA
jgi:hypothetical protein